MWSAMARRIGVSGTSSSSGRSRPPHRVGAGGAAGAAAHRSCRVGGAGGEAGAAGAGGAGGATGPGASATGWAPRCSMNARMSSFVTRPPRPLPLTWARLIPYLRASDLTNGEARFGAPSEPAVSGPGPQAEPGRPGVAGGDGASATRARAPRGLLAG